MLHKITTACLLSFAIISQSFSAPAADILPQWDNSNEANQTAIDHSQWQALIDEYVSAHKDGINRVDYALLKKNDADTLSNYLKSLQEIDPRDYNKKQQFAYWVNLYNAATVQLIITNYPVKSIRKIKDGFLSFGPWDIQWLKVGNEKLSLNDVEHRILRPIWQDNRIHYAVNCASMGCPNLDKNAFTAENAENVLNQAASDYINHPRGVKIEKDKLTVSSIYKWYLEDFNTSESTLIAHLKKFAKPRLKSQLNTLKNDSFDHDYDWSLNEHKAN